MAQEDSQKPGRHTRVIELDKDTLQRVHDLAALRGVSVSAVVNAALDTHKHVVEVRLNRDFAELKQEYHRLDQQVFDIKLKIRDKKQALYLYEQELARLCKLRRDVHAQFADVLKATGQDVALKMWMEASAA